MQRTVNKKQKILQDISIFSTGIYVAQIAFFLRGFLNATIAGPAMYGLWAALNIVLSFGFYVHLGVLHGMSREIPVSIGKGNYDRVDRIRSNAYGFCLISSLLTAIFVIGLSFFFKRSLGLMGIVGIVTISVLIVIQNLVNFYEMALSAVKKFILIAAADFLFPAICVLLTLLLVTRWKIYGIYTVAIFGPLVTFIFYQCKARYRPRIMFELKEVSRLIKIGIPLMSLLLFPVIFFAIDKILIFKFLGYRELGYYALALLLCRFLLYFPGVVTRVIEPRLFHRYGEGENIEDLKKYLFIPARAMSILMPVLIGVSYFIFSFIITHFMEQYRPSAAPLLILLFGRFFLIFAPTTVSFLTALNKQYRILNFYLIAIFLTAVLDIAVLKSGFGLIGVALVASGVNFLLGTSLFLYAAHFYLNEFFDYIKTCIRLYLPYLCTGFFVIGLNFIFGAGSSFPEALLFVILKAFLLIFMSLPFIIHLNKEIHVLEEVASILKFRRKS